MIERISRKVSEIGNGAHVFVPRSWVGETIAIVKQKKTLKERIFNTLYPYLPNIKGIYLFGSHARNEAKISADIDILIITDKKLNIKASGMEIICIPEKEMKKISEKNPVFIQKILSEAKPILNSALLMELRLKNKITPTTINSFILSTENIISKIEGIIKRDKRSGVTIGGVAYSLIFRLRGVYIILCLITKKQYSNLLFQQWLEEKIKKEELKPIIKAYLAIKQNRKGNEIEINAAEKLLTLLKDEICNLKYDKKEKTT